MNATELEIIRTDIPSLVRNYKQRGPYSYQWSCDICGDSIRFPHKARFGVSKVGQELVCNCFNCGWSGSFLTYLRYQHPDLAKRVTRSNFIDKTEIQHDLNSLIDKVDSEILREIFYINKESNIKQWLASLAKLKIDLNKHSLQKLYQLHKKVHYENQN